MFPDHRVRWQMGLARRLPETPDNVFEMPTMEL